MNDMVPKGWFIGCLGDGIEILSGYPFRSSEFTENPKKIGLIRIRDLSSQVLETFYNGDYSAEYIINNGDILIGMDGDFNIVKWKGGAALLNQRICKIWTKTDSEYDNNFIFYSLLPELDRIHNSTGATTVKHLSVKDIRGIEKHFPPQCEQKKIATILTSVDTVIEKTEAQIEKLQFLKKGMMRELLTKGIGHTEFKDTLIGKIPKSWKLVQLDAICNKITDGEHQTPKRIDKGYYLLSARNIRDGFISVKDVDYIPEEEYVRISKRVLPKEGDVLISCSGSIGRTAVVPPGLTFSMVRSVAILQPKSALVESNFLAYQISSSLVQDQIQKTLSQLAQANLFQGAIKILNIILPSLNEQKKISEIIGAIDKRIKSRMLSLAKYNDLKKGLMQDLLTGKVRVKVD